MFTGLAKLWHAIRGEPDCNAQIVSEARQAEQIKRSAVRELQRTINEVLVSLKQERAAHDD